MSGSHRHDIPVPCGGHHPSLWMPRGSVGMPSQPRHPSGSVLGCRQAHQQVYACLVLAGGTRVAGQRGATWQRGWWGCVCLYVLCWFFSSRSRPGVTERALCLLARLPVTAPGVSQPPCMARSHFGRSCLGILMQLINTPRCNHRAGCTPSPAFPFWGKNNQMQPGTPIHGASPCPKLTRGTGPTQRHKVITKGEIPMLVLSQPRELWGVMWTPLSSSPGVAELVLRLAQGCAKGCGTG